MLGPTPPPPPQYNTKSNMPEQPEIVARLIQRADDTEEAIRIRLATFHANAKPLRAAFPQLEGIDGNREPDSIFLDISAVLDK
jgi:adenylate kinase